MARPKKYELPDNMTFDRQSGRYVVRNPETGKRKTYVDQVVAEKAAKLLNEYLAVERARRALDAGKPTVSALVDWWLRDRLQFMPWDESTVTKAKQRLNRIKREIGARTIDSTDRAFLDDWLGFCKTADQYNKWRNILSLLWRFAVARKLARENEGELLEPRSTSKKIAANRKVRRPIDIDGFWKIHQKAPPWLQIAMEQSLVTLQARTEICRMRHEHYRGGYLYVIRDKVSADSDMAFIKIALTEQILDIQKRARQSNIASPFLVHRSPRRRRKDWTDGKPHWSAVNPEYLSKAFAQVRDEVGIYNHLDPEERPPFHEIRGLGSRLYQEQGMSEADIQALMTHASQRTTEIYLQGGEKAVKDSDYIPVRAPMVLAALAKKSGG